MLDIYEHELSALLEMLKEDGTSIDKCKYSIAILQVQIWYKWEIIKDRYKNK